MRYIRPLFLSRRSVNGLRARVRPGIASFRSPHRPPTSSLLFFLFSSSSLRPTRSPPPPTRPTMLLIGLTGSISTGKSTVSAILAAPPHNLPIIDADLLARQVVAPGTKGHAAIVAHFAASTPGLLLAPDGALDRAVLGKRVFGTDPARQQDRRVLNGIVHPLVRQEMSVPGVPCVRRPSTDSESRYRAIATHYLRGHWACVLDIPLLFESSLDLLCGAVLVVAVSSRAVQLSRLLARDAQLTREDAERRVASQMPIGEKTARARHIYAPRARGYVLDNDGSVEDLRARVADTLARVRAGRDGWWRWALWVLPPLAGAVAGGVFLMNWWWRRRWIRAKEKEKARL